MQGSGFGGVKFVGMSAPVVTVCHLNRGLMFRPQNPETRVRSSGFRARGSGFRVQGSGSGFGVQGSGFRVQHRDAEVVGRGLAEVGALRLSVEC